MMKLIITDSIRKQEADLVKEVFGLDVLKIAAKKCIYGLGKTIKNSEKISGSSLKKLLSKNLDLIFDDISNGHYQEYEL